MIDWTEQAARQLDQAKEYIALYGSPEVADRIAYHIMSSVERLETFPMSGRVGRVRGTRELVISNTPFIVAYSIAKSRVVVLAIVLAHLPRRPAMAGEILAATGCPGNEAVLYRIKVEQRS